MNDKEAAVAQMKKRMQIAFKLKQESMLVIMKEKEKMDHEKMISSYVLNLMQKVQ